MHIGRWLSKTISIIIIHRYLRLNDKRLKRLIKRWNELEIDKKQTIYFS